MIRNLRTEEIVSKEHYLLTGVFEQGKGLMFKPKTDKAYIFAFDRYKQVEFHTSFVFFPIDMIFLDDDKRVLKIRTGVRPFRFITDKARYVLELVANPHLNIRPGDCLEWD